VKLSARRNASSKEILSGVRDPYDFAPWGFVVIPNTSTCSSPSRRWEISRNAWPEDDSLRRVPSINHQFTSRNKLRFFGCKINDSPSDIIRFAHVSQRMFCADHFAEFTDA